jgi:CRISPR-associated protein Cas2
MAEPRPVRVLAYDISNDRIRDKVAGMLEEVAVRVQFSLFEARLTARQLDRLMARIEPLIEHGDKFRVYTLADRLLAQCRSIGGTPLPERHDFWLL